MPHPIATLGPLLPFERALATLGYDHLEQVVGVAQTAGPQLAAFLGVSPLLLTAIVNNLLSQADAIPAQALQIIRSAPYKLGVDLDRIPNLTVAPPTTLPPDPQLNINLVSEMPPVLDQAARGTCVAFASLAAYEHVLHGQGVTTTLSEQFLYWNCKRSDQNPSNEGTFIGIAFPLLQREGCCPATTWIYNPTVIPNDEGQGPPPDGAQVDALNFRIGGFKQLAPTSVADIQNELVRGRCVAFSIPVFDSWYKNEWVRHTGDIVMPVPGEIATGGHAMCIVGCLPSPAQVALDGGQFIIRNSWDQAWGISSPHGVGYGTIPYRYIRRFAREAYSIA